MKPFSMKLDDRSIRLFYIVFWNEWFDATMKLQGKSFWCSHQIKNDNRILDKVELASSSLNRPGEYTEAIILVNGALGELH